MSAQVAELVERRDHALRDLAELERQVAEGEVDAADAEQLRRIYEAEAAAAMSLLDADAGDPTAVAVRRRHRWPTVVATLVVGAAVAALARGAAVDRPPGGYVTGIEVNQGAGGRDLSTVTNEELEAQIAATPDILPMRLALARRYFHARDYDRAIGHYRYVLDREPDPEALAHVGWMVFVSGRTDVALGLIEEALVRRPDDPVALWFLANVRYYGLDDGAGAIDALDRLLTNTAVLGNARQQAVSLRQRIVAQSTQEP